MRLSHDRVIIKPCLGVITRSIIEENIRQMGPRRPGVPLRGHSIMIDEIAMDECGRWIEDQQAVGGLCREHGYEAKTKIKTKATFGL